MRVNKRHQESRERVMRATTALHQMIDRVEEQGSLTVPEWLLVFHNASTNMISILMKRQRPKLNENS